MTSRRVEDLPLVLPGQLSLGDLEPDYSRLSEAERWRLYEVRKAAIIRTAQTAREYEERIRALVKELGL